MNERNGGTSAGCACHHLNKGYLAGESLIA